MSETNESAQNLRPSAGNTALFLVLFLIPALLSYFSGAIIFLGAMNEDIEVADTIRNVYLGFLYVIMLVACFIRGKAVGRLWLIVFPIVAAIFDIGLPIPFVPTVMFIVVLVIGFISSRPSPAPQAS